MVVDQITQIIDTIAQKLSVAAEAVYPMLIKQADVFEATYHVTLWILGISALLFVASAIWMGVAFCKASDTIPFAAVAVIFVGIIVLIAAIIAGIDLKEYLTSVYNPDMRVVKYVVRLLM